MSVRARDVPQVNNRTQLKLFANHLGLRDNWHEPDEQGVCVRVYGRSFDNAMGCEGFGAFGHETARREVCVAVYQCPVGIDDAVYARMIDDGDADPKFVVNLADLFAFACGYEGRED